MINTKVITHILSFLNTLAIPNIVVVFPLPATLSQQTL